MMLPDATLIQAEALLATYRTRGWKIATAESCTGGLIAASLTAIAGSSDVVERGFVTYSNEAKTDLLGVDPAVIGGAVLRIDDTVYDGSVANQLQSIRQQMIDRSVHEIQSRRDRFRYPAGS